VTPILNIQDTTAQNPEPYWDTAAENCGVIEVGNQKRGARLATSNMSVILSFI
jgi:hypothetical protein